ncbi:DUF4265 domain-containing protein [Actinomadura spongiicola]|uniref:DUF4265 domain-containing protein n=1 Tax=Actinomadura spongiicola TaxID=2303421 RepID=A0A372GNK6_9ACTN|nr:DUF4265 domain-containing protein [Actinomadura spongiicola]RFS86981.1 DUF4265 domain-containing protein [Actinomadura spongiicola]
MTTHEHAQIWAGDKSDGQPAYEMVPVERLPDGQYKIVGTPALVLGCAAGDTVTLDEAMRVRVLHHGGNLAIQAFPIKEFAHSDVERLREAMTPLSGLVEAPANLRFIVVTVPMSAGIPHINSTMNEWAATANAEWSYGNAPDALCSTASGPDTA